MSNEKKEPHSLGCRGDEILPSYTGIIIHQYKDPYSTNQDSKVLVFFVTQIPIRVEPFDTSLKDCGFKSVVTWMSKIGTVTDFIPHSYLGGGFLPIVLIYSTMSMWIWTLKISTLTIIFFVIGWFKPNLAIP